LQISATIALRIIKCEESMGDFILDAEAGYLLAGKVRSVVGDDGVGYPKRHTMFCQRNLTICCPVTSERDTALTHLMK